MLIGNIISILTPSNYGPSKHRRYTITSSGRLKVNSEELIRSPKFQEMLRASRGPKDFTVWKKKGYRSIYGKLKK